MRRYTSALIAVLLLAPMMAWAQGGPTIYHVAQQQAEASDSNPGTQQKPWKTISRAAETLQPGDTVIVHAGTYREWVHPRNSGTVEAPICYTAAPGEQVVITGADVMSGWTRESGVEPIYRIPWTHQFIIGVAPDGTRVEFHPDSAPLWGRTEQVIVDGKQLRPEANLADLRKAWEEHQKAVKAGQPSPVQLPPLPNLGPTFNGAFAVDTSQKAMWIWIADGSNPNTHKVEASTRDECFGENQWQRREGVQYIQVRGFTFRYAATFPQRPAVLLLGNNNLLENCLVEQMAGTGCIVSGVMRRCVVRNNGHTGGSAYTAGFLNEDCLWEGNSWKPIDRGWDSAGVKMAGVDGGIFRRCTFRRNGGAGLWFDIDVRNILVTDCVFQENESTGLFIEISRNITAVNNLAIRNAVGIVGNSKWQDGWSNAGIGLGEAMNCVVAHNTCIGNKDGIAIRDQGPRPTDSADLGSIPYHTMNDVVVNNICAYNKGFQFAIWSDNGFFGMHPMFANKFKDEAEYQKWLAENKPDEIYDPLKQGLLIDHNFYAVSGDQKAVLYGAPWHGRSKQFKTADEFAQYTRVFDVHSRTGDPMFVDARGDNYRLKAGSPARGTYGWLLPPTNPMQWPALPAAGR